MSSALLLMVKGAISELSDEEQASVYACALEIKGAVLKGGDAGVVALALVSAEMGAEA